MLVRMIWISEILKTEDLVPVTKDTKMTRGTVRGRRHFGAPIMSFVWNTIRQDSPPVYECV